MKTHPTDGMPSLALAAVLLIIFGALTATHAADLAATDCSAPVANGGLGYCGPSQVCECVLSRPPSDTPSDTLRDMMYRYARLPLDPVVVMSEGHRSTASLQH